MTRTMLQRQIHRAPVTRSNLNRHARGELEGHELRDADVNRSNRIVGAGAAITTPLTPQEA